MHLLVYKNKIAMPNQDFLLMHQYLQLNINCNLND